MKNWLKNESGFGISQVLGAVAILVVTVIMMNGVLSGANRTNAITLLTGEGYLVVADEATINTKLDDIKTAADLAVTAAETAVDNAEIAVTAAQNAEIAAVEARDILEDHVHNRERWYGISANQAANDWATIDTMTPFVAMSGNNTWGGATATDYAKVFGTDDTPIFLGGGSFDIHRILVFDNTSGTLYKVRVIWGTGTVEEAIAAEQFSSFFWTRPTADKSRLPIDIMTKRIAVDTKVWVNVWNATNDATLSFFVGVHEYD